MKDRRKPYEEPHVPWWFIAVCCFLAAAGLVAGIIDTAVV